MHFFQTFVTPSSTGIHVPSTQVSRTESVCTFIRASGRTTPQYQLHYYQMCSLGGQRRETSI